MEEIQGCFPTLTDIQLRQFGMLGDLYNEWNSKINVISRKDIGSLYTRHVLHSLAIAKVQPFAPASDVLDVGTGGGFPGIPLAIMFPETNFDLIDIIGKKITVVKAVAESLGLKNVKAYQQRAENASGKYDFIVSRAVTNMPDFVSWVRDKVKKTQFHELKNGVLYLKGGDLTEELKPFVTVSKYDISDFFDDPFFETKKVVYLPIKSRS